MKALSFTEGLLLRIVRSEYQQIKWTITHQHCKDKGGCTLSPGQTAEKDRNTVFPHSAALDR